MLNRFLIFAIATLFSTSCFASDAQRLEREDCYIQNEHEVFASVNNYSCTLYDYSNHGSKNVFLITDSQTHVIFAAYFKGGPGLFYKFTSNAKNDTTKYLKDFPYIGDNWEKIYSLKSKKKTTILASDEKVVLYNIDLRDLRGCVGFAKGTGATAPIIGGTGTNNLISGLLCDVGNNSTLEDLVEIISSTKFKKIR